MEKKIITMIVLIALGLTLLAITKEEFQIEKNTPTKETIESIEFDKIEDAKDRIVLGTLNNKRVVASATGIFVDENINNAEVILKENGYYIVKGEKVFLKRNGIVLHELKESNEYLVESYDDGYVLITYENGENELIRSKELIAKNIDKNTIYKDKKDISAKTFWYYGTKEHPNYYETENKLYILNKETIKEYTILDKMTQKENQKYYLITDNEKKYLYQTSNQRLQTIDKKIDSFEAKVENEQKIMEENNQNHILVKNQETNLIAVLDNKGKLKTDFIYEKAVIKDKYLIVNQNGKYGITTLDNKKILEIEYDDIKIVENYIVTVKEEKIQVRNTEMEIIPQTEISYPHSQATLQANKIGQYLHLKIKTDNIQNIIIGKQGIIKELNEETKIFEQNKEIILVTKEQQEKLKLKFTTIHNKELGIYTVEEGNSAEVIKINPTNSNYIIKIYQDNQLKKVINYEINIKKGNTIYDSKEYVHQLTSKNREWKYMLKNNILKLYSETTNEALTLKDVVSFKQINETYGIIETSEKKWKLIQL